jgi:transcriptional antiterminator RfaH
MPTHTEFETPPAPAEPMVWVVVVSKPGQERRAKRELEQQGFEVYLPMSLSMHIKSRQMVAAPYFPRYLFARVSLAVSAWRKIWNTFGVQGLLGQAERPVGVADALIELIRLREEAGFIKVGLQADGAQFARGARVKLIGELEFEGVFQERVDDKRAMILVSFLGRDSRFVVDLRKLRSTGG